jgi:hypothetical protein
MSSSAEFFEFLKDLAILLAKLNRLSKAACDSCPVDELI